MNFDGFASGNWIHENGWKGKEMGFLDGLLALTVRNGLFVFVTTGCVMHNVDDALRISNLDDVICRDDTSIMNIPTNWFSSSQLLLFGTGENPFLS
jgi:hypothetical protein